MKTDIPENILSAVNALLAPYGEKFVPGEGTALTGYKSRLDACHYLGCSPSTLSRLVYAGYLHPIKLVSEARNGKVVFAISELENYAASRRALLK